MNFCSSCGQSVALRIPAGDDRERYVCESCGSIFYSNPRVIVGCLPVHEGRILLCRRAIEPRKNYWTLPAGFMENGETTELGAARETWEEACARGVDLKLYRLFDVPHISQVYMFYLCGMKDGYHKAGPESLETALFAPQDIPWKEIAFPVIYEVLEEYIEDSKTGTYPIRISEIDRRWLRPPL